MVVRAESEGIVSDTITIKSIIPEAKSIAVFAKPHSILREKGKSTIIAEIRDYFGTIIPSIEREVTYKLEGAALFDNGKKVLKTKTVKGRATVNIVSIDEEGSISVSVFSNGLVPGKVELLVK